MDMKAEPSIAAEALASAPAVWPEDAIEVGRVLDAWGVKGWIKIQPFSSDPGALLRAREWFVKADSASNPNVKVGPLGQQVCLSVVQSREHGDHVVAHVKEVLDRNAAEALRGYSVYVSRANFPRTAQDEYYWIDLIGLQVKNRTNDELGTVVGLIDTGPHSVFRIQPADQSADEILIPFVSAYVDTVSLEDRCITVDWGLDY